MSRRSRTAQPELEAGDLLAVEAIDPSGLIVTSDGAFVRVIEVVPPNPMVLSAEDCDFVAATYRRLAGRLRPGQTVQFYVEARPVNLDELLVEARREVEAVAGPRPADEALAGGSRAASRWRLYDAMEESLRLHADDQAAVQQRAYVIVPYIPHQRVAADLLRQLRTLGRGLPTAPLERDLKAHRRAVRESLAHADAIRGALDPLSLPTRMLNGEQIVSLLWGRFNPTLADAGRGPRGPIETEVLGSLDDTVDATAAREAAARLRESIARSSVDFRRSKHYAEVDRDIEQTIYMATTAEATHMGALMGAMMTRQPFSLSVHVHALDRRSERRKLKMSYRRLFAVNRGAESRGRVPDFDRYAQEQENQELLAELAGQDNTNLFRVSAYQTIRARGPEPDPALLAEAVDFCIDQVQIATDARVHRGEFQQQELWQSSLPLGRDVAGRTRKYATRNVGDLVPLVGTSCGSPTGIPFAFTDPGRTLELLNPYDRSHANQTLLIAGRSGSGKTLCANVVLSRCLAHGARAFVLDRAGHYTVLTHLVEGARQVDIGADDSEFAINPWDVDDPGNVPLEKIAFLVSLHQVMMGDEGLTTLERAQLGAAIRAVYAKATPARPPREARLRDELLDRSASEQADGSIEIAAVLRNLAERLGEFCEDGSYAYLLDRETSVPTDSPLVVFETRRCPDVVLKPVMFAIVEYVTRAIEEHRTAHRADAALPGAPMFTGKSILLIDEGWAMVGNPEIGSFANDLARRARHLGLFLIVMSQHLSDFDNEHGIALLRNSTMQMFLEQHPEEVPFVQEALRLSDQEAQVLTRLKTVKGSHSQLFWVNGTRGRGRVALRVGPTEYWCYTSDPLQDAPQRDRVIAQHGGDAWAGIAALARGAGLGVGAG